MHLLSSTCVPSQLFGTEAAIGGDAKELSRHTYSFNRAWFKMFTTFDKYIIYSCQHCTGCLPLEYQIDLRKILFYKSINQYPDIDLVNLFARFSSNDRLLCKYDVNLSDSVPVIKAKFQQHFVSILTVLGVI